MDKSKPVLSYPHSISSPTPAVAGDFSSGVQPVFVRSSKFGLKFCGVLWVPHALLDVGQQILLGLLNLGKAKLEGLLYHRRCNLQ